MPQPDKHLPPSTFTGIVKKSQRLGFGVFIDIWSIGAKQGLFC
jgi:hypothetical protein